MSDPRATDGQSPGDSGGASRDAQNPALLHFIRVAVAALSQCLLLAACLLVLRQVVSHHSDVKNMASLGLAAFGMFVLGSTALVSFLVVLQIGLSREVNYSLKVLLQPLLCNVGWMILLVADIVERNYSIFNRLIPYIAHEVPLGLLLGPAALTACAAVLCRYTHQKIGIGAGQIALSRLRLLSCGFALLASLALTMFCMDRWT